MLEFKDRWIILFFLGLIVITLLAAQNYHKPSADRFFTLFDLIEAITDDDRGGQASRHFVEGNSNDSATLRSSGLERCWIGRNAVFLTSQYSEAHRTSQ